MAATKSTSHYCLRKASSAATATSVPSFTCSAGASPAPASPLPVMVHFGGILIHSRVQTLVITVDRGCGRLLWLAARVYN